MPKNPEPSGLVAFFTIVLGPMLIIIAIRVLMALFK
jgi:hypothetical protein